jgi:hypothetical protein
MRFATLLLSHSTTACPAHSGELGFNDYNLAMKTVYSYVPSPEHIYPDHPERPGRFERL